MLATLIASHRDQRAASTGEALARRFESASALLIHAVEQHWVRGGRRPGGTVGWSIPAEARHVAETHLPLARFVQAVATDRPLPSLGGNCADAQAWRNGELAPSVETETLELLHTSGVVAAAVIRELDDEQLRRSCSYFGTKLSAAQLIEELLIAHIEEHLGGLG